jgi:hypothetical protein
MLSVLKYFNHSDCVRVFSAAPLRILQPRTATSIVAELAIRHRQSPSEVVGLQGMRREVNQK